MDVQGRNSNIDIQSMDEILLSLDAVSSDLTQVLFEDIIPIWSTIGFNHVTGGFNESIDSEGTVPECMRRIRVSARQVYVFCEASRLGWNRLAATTCLRHGRDFLFLHSNAEGLIHHNLSSDGRHTATGHDLYDQAFLLFAYANVFAHMKQDADLQRGRDLLAAIRRNFTHGRGGFIDHTEKPFPLRSNPHMHLLEAALAWIAIDDDPRWRILADEIVLLFQQHFFDEASGVVREYFTADWSPIRDDGQCRIEPGHNYEWAWLLMRWEKLTGGHAGDCADRMINFAETYGYDPVRHVAINELWTDGRPCDRTARLWPQTERLKAWLAVAEASHGLERRQAELRALDAANGLLATWRQACRGSGMI
ncbi:AGE family epimerase/isomerase [Aliirhizobium terrae]|uniref:AGE family epimerase/isomerase n=1 Tax=Terrirhizobium terrae TaxID=2926709 RepID=UPI00257557BA|nr:AGE family epimerase/isomerase [Rhizobium sp. CC-CFT758]WJH41116.1 AGE family epimerase/isomerase [Rhizobium sp. CC-CFT758]